MRGDTVHNRHDNLVRPTYIFYGYKSFRTQAILYLATPYLSLSVPKSFRTQVHPYPSQSVPGINGPLTLRLVREDEGGDSL